MGELADEPRLTDARLADDRRHLAVPGAGELQRAAELFELGIAADESSEPSARRRPAGACGRGRRR